MSKLANFALPQKIFISCSTSALFLCGFQAANLFFSNFSLFFSQNNEPLWPFETSFVFQKQHTAGCRVGTRDKKLQLFSPHWTSAKKPSLLLQVSLTFIWFFFLVLSFSLNLSNKDKSWPWTKAPFVVADSKTADVWQSKMFCSLLLHELAFVSKHKRSAIDISVQVKFHSSWKPDIKILLR